MANDNTRPPNLPLQQNQCCFCLRSIHAIVLRPWNIIRLPQFGQGILAYRSVCADCVTKHSSSNQFRGYGVYRNNR